MTAKDAVRRARARVFAAFAIVALSAGATLVGVAPPAEAQKLHHTTRYQSQNEALSACAPGVYRWSKVWADTYGLDESLHTSFRMQFHTTYSPGVAAAKKAYADMGVRVSCVALQNFKGVDPVPSLMWAACLSSSPKRPNRWCQVAVNNPHSPAVRMHLDERCYKTPPGVTMWHEWHDLRNRVGDAARLYKVDVLAQFASWLKRLGFGLEMPVYLDDVTVVGGVSNFDQGSAQPTWGNAWYGYGRVPTAAASELLVTWYDLAARRLGYDPIATPWKAHDAVERAINAGRQPRGLGLLDVTRRELYDRVLCNTDVSPKVRDVVDPAGLWTLYALGEDLSGWVKAETGKTLCQKIKEVPQYADLAPMLCGNHHLVGMFFDVVDNNRCMNRPNDPIAIVLRTDLGCNRDIHLARLFRQMKAFLGG